MFTLDHLRSLLAARPFVPFRLHRSDGGTVDVPSPEVVFPGKQMAIVGLLDANATDTAWDRFTILWYFHVSGVEMLSAGAAPLTVPPSDPSGNPTPAR